MLTLNFSESVAARLGTFARVALMAIGAVVACGASLFAQTTVSTGSIQGLVTDQSGAVVAGAKITITQKTTGRVIATSSTSSGAYTSGALIPGDYTVEAEASGFKTTQTSVTVEVGVTATGNLKL